MAKEIYTIACDFDGVLFTNNWPDIGEPIWENIIRIKAEKECGHKIVLWTCRSGELLHKAVEKCVEYGIKFDAVNEQLPENIKLYGNDTRKIFANEYWDDRSVPKGIGATSGMKNRVLTEIINTYGVHNQMDIAIEEMSELTKALLKFRRYGSNAQTIGDIREEMADVHIMLQQLELIFGDYSYQENEKLLRQLKRTREYKKAQHGNRQQRRAMKQKTKKHNKPKALVLKPQDVKKIKLEVTENAIKATVTLFISYIMEEEVIACDEDKICEIFDGVMRYSGAVNEHLISLNQVRKIIEEHTGIKIKM